MKDLITKEDIKDMATKDDINHLRDLLKWMVGVVIAVNVTMFAFVLRLVFAH